MARCSWCYKEGHKKPTCPEYRAYCQKRADEGSEHFKGILKPKRRTTRCRYCQERGHNIKTCSAKQEMTAKITELFPNIERITRCLAMSQGVERGGRYGGDYGWCGGIFLGELKLRVTDVVHMIKWGERHPGLLRSSYMDYNGTKRWIARQTSCSVGEELAKLTPEQKENADKLKVFVECTVDDIVKDLSAWDAKGVDATIRKFLSLL